SASSSASGIVLQSRYERREAISQSLRRAICGFVALGDEDETLRAKDRQHSGLHRVAEFFLRIEFRLHDRDVAGNFLVRDWPAECTARERAEAFAHPLHVPLLARKKSGALCDLLVSNDRPVP